MGAVGDTQPPMTRPTTDPPRVRLRDITLTDADLLDVWDSGRTGFNDFGLPRDPTDRDALARGPLRNERNGQLMVELVADGRPIGSVGWHREMYGPNAESSAFNFGIELVPDARGHGYGTEAQALLVEYLFATTDIHRVEASTDVDNLAEQRSLEKAGLRREGVTRGAQFRAGGYHDLIVFALLRDDREA
jgi:RimJ/RimL family protein N-acetyltransferase